MNTTAPLRHLIAGAMLCCPAVAAAAPMPPNIVVIMADDMGMENLSCYGSKVYQTPHLDALAASGIRFLHAHSQPLCTPSRVQIMTGIYNNRNYPMMLPHWPFVPTPDHPDWDPKMWRDMENEPRGTYISQKYWDAIVRYTDKMVGRLVATLEETGQRDNTLILWTGDNGSHTGIVSEFQGRPYRGGKGGTKDNGTHVGFIASWPGVIKPGQTSDALVDFSDVLPTLTAAAGIATPQHIDGTSLLPVFRGKAETRNKDAIYCWYEPDGQRARASQHTRDQRHKLYATGKFYDTVADPDQNHDLAAGGVPAELAAAHAKLKVVLDRRMNDETPKYPNPKE